MIPIPASEPNKTCQSCRSRQATVYAKIGNGTKQVRCQQCAQRAARSGFTRSAIKHAEASK